jgi:hypothetical protein
MRRLVFLLAVMAATLVVASGVGLAVARSGGPGDDFLKGTDGSDVLEGNGGDDDMLSFRGKDTMDGGPGRDAVLGGDKNGPQTGDKVLSGGPGRDFVGGGSGSDELSGGPDADGVLGGPRESKNADSMDMVDAGGGKDVVEVKDIPADKDFADCGNGFDRVLVDGKDKTRNCEKKFADRSEFDNSLKGEGYFLPIQSLYDRP